MMADGSAKRRLVPDLRITPMVDWSPDGREIAFTRLGLIENTGHIYAVEVAGGAVRQVTTTPFRDYLGNWR